MEVTEVSMEASVEGKEAFVEAMEASMEASSTWNRWKVWSFHYVFHALSHVTF